MSGWGFDPICIFTLDSKYQDKRKIRFSEVEFSIGDSIRAHKSNRWDRNILMESFYRPNGRLFIREMVKRFRDFCKRMQVATVTMDQL